MISALKNRQPFRCRQSQLQMPNQCSLLLLNTISHDKFPDWYRYKLVRIKMKCQWKKVDRQNPRSRIENCLSCNCEILWLCFYSFYRMSLIEQQENYNL